MKAQAKTSPALASGLVTRAAIIVAIMVAVSLVGVFAVVQFQLFSFGLAVLAAVVCVISSLVAHVVGEFPKGDDYFAARLALSIMARTGPPFLLVLFVKLIPDSPFQPGFVFFVVLLYLVGLFVDVAMHVSRLQAGQE